MDSVDSEMSSSPEHEIEQESDRPSADLSTNDGEDAAAFAEEPLADEEWTAEYERERKADEEMEKTLRDRLEGTVAETEWYDVFYEIMFIRVYAREFYTLMLCSCILGFYFY